MKERDYTELTPEQREDVVPRLSQMLLNIARDLAYIARGSDARIAAQCRYRVNQRGQVVAINIPPEVVPHSAYSGYYRRAQARLLQAKTGGAR